MSDEIVVIPSGDDNGADAAEAGVALAAGAALATAEAASEQAGAIADATSAALAELRSELAVLAEWRGTIEAAISELASRQDTVMDALDAALAEMDAEEPEPESAEVVPVTESEAPATEPEPQAESTVESETGEHAEATPHKSHSRKRRYGFRK